MKADVIEARIRNKMEAAGVGDATIAAFLDARRRLLRGDRGMIPETEIEPLAELPRLEDLPGAIGNDSQRLRQLVVVKLNGGLGTGMGLDRTKSLIPVRDGATFLDFTARQVLELRQKTASSAPHFLLMNSFTTRAETLGFLSRYPELSTEGDLDFLQSKVLKLTADDEAQPVDWPEDRELEWCPPGHGDFYPSLLNSGQLQKLVDSGVRFAFVSNSDNLGATVDTRILEFFAGSGLSFLMEVAERTSADRKGGHLARRRSSHRLLLRESAQCLPEDEASFQDTTRHRFFNTNNLWIRLDHLQDLLGRQGDALPLPLITNFKTVDPKQGTSPRVIQLESAMGAAIECFEHSGALVVPRSRFSPVKSTSDLLALRSDAYAVTPDHRLVLDPARNGQPPLIDLDSEHYKVLARFEEFFPDGSPSLLACRSLRVRGRVLFGQGVRCEGDVEFQNPGMQTRVVPKGVYRDGTF